MYVNGEGYSYEIIKQEYDIKQLREFLVYK